MALLTVAALGAGALAAPPARAATTVTVSGVVSDANGPMAGAGVDVRDEGGQVLAHAVTDNAGSYAVEVDPGRRDLVATPPAGAALVPTETAARDVLADTVVDVSLHDVPTLDGHLTGIPTPLVNSAWLYTDDGGTSTDLYGAFTLRTNAGSGKRLRGWFRGEGAWLDFTSLIDVTVSRPLQLDLPTRLVTVKVRSHEGAPMAGCTLRASQAVTAGLPTPFTEARAWLSTNSDVDGQAVARLVSDGTPLLTYAYCPGYPAAGASVVPATDDLVTITLPRTATVTAHITGQDGALQVDNGHVTLGGASGAPDGEGTLTLHAEPGFGARLNGQVHTPEGQYWFSGKVDLGAEDTSLYVALPLVRQQVRVVDPQGAEVSGCFVTTSQSRYDTSNPLLEGVWSSLTAFTDATGLASNRMVVTEDTTVQASCDGHPSASTRFTPGVDAVVTLTLPAAAVVEGRITDGDGTLLDAGGGLAELPDAHADVVAGRFTLLTAPGQGKGLRAYFQTSDGSFDVIGTVDVPEQGASIGLQLPLTSIGIRTQLPNGTPVPQSCGAESFQHVTAGLDAPVSSVQSTTYLNLDASGQGSLRLLESPEAATVHVHCEGYPAVDVPVLPGRDRGIRVVFGAPGVRAYVQSKPVVTPVVEGPGSGGWYRDDVTVSWRASTDDPELGPVTQPADVLVTSEGADQVVTSDPACDAAGECATGTAHVSIDRSAPTGTAFLTSVPAGSGGWHRSATVHFACDDALSGVATCPADRAVPEGRGQSVTGEVTDVAGNSLLVTSAPVDVDATAPTLSYTLDPATPGSSGWYTQPVTVHWTCNDVLSGVASCPADTVLGTDGSTSVTGVATDVAGNATTVTTAPVKVDLSAPVVVYLRPSRAPNAQGWYTGPVTFWADCEDGLGSGVASCPGVVVTGPGSGLTETFTVVDRAGNRASIVTQPVNIDTSAPTTQIDTVAAVAAKKRGSTLKGHAWDTWSGVSRVTVAFQPKAAGVTEVATFDCPPAALLCDWEVQLPADMPVGGYQVIARSIDRAGNLGPEVSYPLVVAY